MVMYHIIGARLPTASVVISDDQIVQSSGIASSVRVTSHNDVSQFLFSETLCNIGGRHSSSVFRSADVGVEVGVHSVLISRPVSGAVDATVILFGSDLSKEVEATDGPFVLWSKFELGDSDQENHDLNKKKR